MANTKISALTSATTPLAGTEVLPIVQSGSTVKVSVANLTDGLNTVPATKGGTGQTSYAVGDLLYASTTTALSKLADVATGNALISGGVSTAPSWGKIGLTTHVSGVLPVANGGTNASTSSITSFNNITGYTASGATGTTSTNLVFSTSPTITTPSVTGNLTMSTGNVVMSNGKGIDFSATPGTGTSELFADYEEGTWTPTLAFGGATTGITYSVQTGQYTKVGRQVTLQAYVVLSSKGAATGIATITGLPFNANANNYPATIVDPTDNFLLLVAGGATFIVLAVDTLYFSQQTTTGRNVMTDTNFTNTSNFKFFITYFV
jgi:hypothetical protein